MGLLAVILFLSSLFVIFEGPEFSFGVRVDPSIRSLLPTTGDEIEFLEEVQNRYSSDDLLLVTWIDENLFSPSNLASFKKLTRRIEEMPGVEDVESLATAIQTKVYEDYTEVNPYAVVKISGKISNSSCEQKKCPSLPKAVTTSSEI